MAPPHAAAGKLRFTVAACSGEDPDYPARELHFHTPQTRGWQSPRFCDYPQELTLRLESASRLTQLQLLSHEYKIASKVELFTGTLPPGDQGSSLDRVQWKRLGHISFDSNTASGHQARELKSVHVTVPSAIALRIVVHRCHVNKLNIYNQVGIVALNIIGEPLAQQRAAPDPYALGQAGLPPGYGGPQPGYAQRALAAADLAIDMDVDPVTAEKIREIYQQKEQAVAREDYDEAKRLKEGINRLKAVGAKIAQLEMRKAAAVEAEDYDTAKAIKADIDKLRGHAGQVALGVDAPPPKGKAAKSPDDIFNRALSKGGKPPPFEVAAPPPPPPPVDASLESLDVPMDERPAVASSIPPEPEFDPYEGVPHDDRPAVASGHAASVFAGSAGGYWHRTGGVDLNHEEQPAVGSAANAMMSTPTRFKDKEGGSTASGYSAYPEPVDDGPAPVAAAGGPPPPDGFPPDLPPPEALSAANAKDAGTLIDLVGEYTVMCLFSKTWMLREAALNKLDSQVKGGELGGEERNTFRLLCKIPLASSLKDKVANVFHCGVRLLRQSVEAYGPGVGTREVQQSTSDLIPPLLEKMGDSNTRIRDAANDALLFLASDQHVGANAVSHHLLKPLRNPNQWKPFLARLQLCHELVPMAGLSKSGDGLTLENVMTFINKGFDSSNGDVRNMSVKVALEVQKQAGPAMQKHLPKNLKPAIRDMLDGGAGQMTSADATPPPAAKPKPAAKKTTPAAKPAPPPAPPPAEEPAGELSAAELEAQLSQRKRELGKDHPDVAATITELAHLRSDEENYAEAQKLHEEALRIQEQSLGPEHADTVQTLTDLAICHLDQGHNDEGRPLLERALKLQTKALGPDNADVLAIKDVLQSLDAEEEEG